MLNNKKGTSVLLAVLVLSIVLSISFGISGILLRQLRMVRSTGLSVVAFYAADAGIEKVLLSRSSPQNIPKTWLPNGTSYEVTVNPGGIGGCPITSNFCIKSVGIYEKTRRAIEIEY